MSEVARFRQEQALQEEAGKQGLSGLAIVASHETITARMEIGAQRILQLIQEGKHEEAQALFAAPDWCPGGSRGART
jgi:hypothetical protein